VRRRPAAPVDLTAFLARTMPLQVPLHDRRNGPLSVGDSEDLSQVEVLAKLLDGSAGGCHEAALVYSDFGKFIRAFSRLRRDCF
jgi:hypothetical protein